MKPDKKRIAEGMTIVLRTARDTGLERVKATFVCSCGCRQNVGSVIINLLNESDEDLDAAAAMVAEEMVYIEGERRAEALQLGFPEKLAPLAMYVESMPPVENIRTKSDALLKKMLTLVDAEAEE